MTNLLYHISAMCHMDLISMHGVHSMHKFLAFVSREVREIWLLEDIMIFSFFLNILHLFIISKKITQQLFCSSDTKNTKRKKQLCVLQEFPDFLAG